MSERRLRIVPTGLGCGRLPEAASFALELVRIDRDFFGGAPDCIDCRAEGDGDSSDAGDDEAVADPWAHGSQR